MVKFILLIFTFILIGCKTNEVNIQEQPIIVAPTTIEKTIPNLMGSGKKVAPPFGCIEYRKRGGEC